MDATLQTLLRFYAFSTGRRIFALREVKKLAVAAGQQALVLQCDAAIAHDRSTRALESKWSAGKDATLYSPETSQLDVLVDIALGALRDTIDAEARDSAPGDTLGEAATNLQQEIFPNGVAAITTLPFVDELDELERIIEIVQSPKWSSVVQSLGLARRVARIVDLETKYRAAIAVDTKTISFSQVKDARAQGQSLLLSVVAHILGLYPTDTSADLTSRQALLAPILRQNEAIRQALRQKHTVEDVDPDTGLPEATPPAPPPKAPEDGG